MRWPLSIGLFHFFAKIGQFPMFLAVERFWRSWLQITVLHKARVHLALNRDVALVNFVQASRLTSWSWKTVAHAKAGRCRVCSSKNHRIWKIHIPIGCTIAKSRCSGLGKCRNRILSLTAQLTLFVTVGANFNICPRVLIDISHDRKEPLKIIYGDNDTVTARLAYLTKTIREEEAHCDSRV
jgi:hypothetical protein